MSSCKSCGHLIDILDEERIICEAHKFSVEKDTFIEIPYEDLLEYCKEIWLVCCVNKDKISE